MNNFGATNHDAVDAHSHDKSMVAHPLATDPLEIMVMSHLARLIPGWDAMDEAAREAARMALPLKRRTPSTTSS